MDVITLFHILSWLASKGPLKTSVYDHVVLKSNIIPSTTVPFTIHQYIDVFMDWRWKNSTLYHHISKHCLNSTCFNLTNGTSYWMEKWMWICLEMNEKFVNTSFPSELIIFHFVPIISNGTSMRHWYLLNIHYFISLEMKKCILLIIASRVMIVYSYIQLLLHQLILPVQQLRFMRKLRRWPSHGLLKNHSTSKLEQPFFILPLR